MLCVNETHFGLSSISQTHVGVAGGSISNPVDMEAFKRQQAMAQAGRATLTQGKGGGQFSFVFFVLYPPFCFMPFCLLLLVSFSPLPICFCLLSIPASFPSSVFEACNPENRERSFPTDSCWCANIIAMCQVFFFCVFFFCSPSFCFLVLYLIFFGREVFCVLRVLCVLHPRSG